MSWEEHAAALAECFQGKALALPPGPAKPCSLRGPACGPSVQPAGESRNPPSYVSTWALAQRLVATSHGYRHRLQRPPREPACSSPSAFGGTALTLGQCRTLADAALSK